MRFLCFLCKTVKDTISIDPVSIQLTLIRAGSITLVFRVMAVKMISHLLFGLAILCIVLHYSVTAFSSGVFRRISFRRQVLDTLSARPFGVTTAIKAADSDKSKPPEGPDAGLSKYECVSCAYVYDEAKGFKKRIPPGTYIYS